MMFLALAAAGCERRREGAINVTVIGESLGLADPADETLTEPQAVLLANVAQGLVRFDARGQIVPGLAERWNVSDDGLSYIFRLAADEWPDGERITAEQVARILRRQIRAASNNPLRATLGAVDEVVAMTDRVVEIRLNAPRPNLLQILAQPEMAILRDDQGTGPFRIVTGGEAEEEEEEAAATAGELLLAREVPIPDEEETRREEVRLAAAAAQAAIERFRQGGTDLVLGGRFNDLPYARTPGVSSDALRFDPASGLFGLIPARSGGLLGDEEVRQLLSQSIDRQALVEALQVPGLLPRATSLEPGLEGMPDPVPPDWAAIPVAERRAALQSTAEELFAGREERPVLKIALPEGPGGDILLRRLATDWGALGIGVERAASAEQADLRLIDSVAPSTSAAWFLRHFLCDRAPICSPDADTLLQAARAAPVAAQRSALLAEAARLMDEAQLFLPLAAPIRWSLVSTHVQGFAGNRFARHPLTELGEPLNPERAE